MKVNTDAVVDLSSATNYTREDVKAELLLFFESSTGWVSFEQIKGNVLSLSGAEDGVVHQACIDVGYCRTSP